MNIIIHFQVVLSRVAFFVAVNRWAVGIVPGRVAPGCPTLVRSRDHQFYAAGPLVITGWIPK